MKVKGGLAASASDAAVGGPAKLRRRHQHAPRSPLQSLDTNRPDYASQEDLITPRNATPVRHSDCANANDGVIVTKRPGNHGASFFSPPRAIREPIPFLSPTVPNYKDFVGTDDVRLLRNPALTMRYFLEGVAECALRNIRWPAVLTKKVTGAILTVLASLWGLLHLTLAGRFDDLVRANNDTRTLPSDYGAWLISATMEASFWVGCGILSTAGLGSGVQTGALILFPHCVSLAVEWADSQESDGNSNADATKTFAELMWSVAIPGFWSGSGSAIGELLPYVLARMIKSAGGDPFALLEEPDIPDPRSLEFDESGQSRQKKKSLMSVLVANTRSAMEGQLLESKWNAFLKLFILAAVPNGLFDLCGLVCGAAGVSFWLFFGAVWSGKALVRTPLQTCGLAAAVAFCSTGTLIDDNSDGADEDLSVRTMALKMAKDAVNAIVRGDEHTIDNANTDGAASQASMTALLVCGIKTAWTFATFGLLGFFCLSTIEQVAQHHAKTIRKRSVERKTRSRRARC